MGTGSGGGIGFPKGEPRKRKKARARRLERVVVQTVRPQVEDRDGRCRLLRLLGAPFGPCSDPSEWAHMTSHRRARTMGQAPERRHTTAASLMLCGRHHDAYDAGALTIEPMTDAGADGRLRVRAGDVVVEEP